MVLRYFEIGSTHASLFIFYDIYFIFRYIEIFRSSRADIKHVVGQPRDPYNRPPFMNPRPGPYDRPNFSGPRYSMFCKCLFSKAFGLLSCAVQFLVEHNYVSQ